MLCYTFSMNNYQETNGEKGVYFSTGRKILGAFFGVGIGLLLFLIIGAYFLKGIGTTTFLVSLLFVTIGGGVIGWKCYSSIAISNYAPYIKVGFMSIVLFLISIAICINRDNYIYFIIGLIAGVAMFFILKGKIRNTWMNAIYFKSYIGRTDEEISLASKIQSQTALGTVIALIALVVIESIYGKAFLQYLILPISFVLTTIGTFFLFALPLLIKAKSSGQNK